MGFINKYRLIIILCLFVLIPLGFYTKLYTGRAQVWVNNSLGGLFYEIFWCLIVALVFPRINPLRIAFWVFAITSILEFTQRWTNPFLEIVRQDFIGRTIFGNSFNWFDFPYYFMGCLMGYLLLIVINKISNINSINHNT